MFYYLSETLPLSQNLYYFRGSRFSQCFTINSSLLLARYRVSFYVNFCFSDHLCSVPLNKNQTYIIHIWKCNPISVLFGCSFVSQDPVFGTTVSLGSQRKPRCISANDVICQSCYVIGGRRTTWPRPSPFASIGQHTVPEICAHQWFRYVCLLVLY